MRLPARAATSWDRPAGAARWGRGGAQEPRGGAQGAGVVLGPGEQARPGVDTQPEQHGPAARGQAHQDGQDEQARAVVAQDPQEVLPQAGPRRLAGPVIPPLGGIWDGTVTLRQKEQCRDGEGNISTRPSNHAAWRHPASFSACRRYNAAFPL